MKSISCIGEYIHPYGKGFIFYTDKKWEEGKIDLINNTVIIRGTQNVSIPLVAILSVDKRILLPAVREGRATILIEYLDIRSRERIYTLFSGEGPCIRELKKNLLLEIVKGIRISIKRGEVWNKGYLHVDGYMIKFEPIGYSFHISSLVNMSRRSMEIGFHKVSVINLKVERGGEKEEINILTPPLKRDFFWQLLNLLLDEYVNREIIMRLTNREKLILQMLEQGWSYENIQAKLEIPQKEMEEIIKKLENMGIIKKIVIVKLTERGKTVMQFIPSQEFE